jgi:hypothetical protein
LFVLNADDSEIPSNIAVADGTIEAIKWLGLGLMLADHINKYVFESNYTVVYDLGRLAMPLFMMAFAYNLARVKGDKQSTYKRIIKRLFIVGAIATPPFIAIGGTWVGWWPLNILFAFLAVTAILYCYDIYGEQWAFLLFAVSGFFVEFFHPALLIGIGTWAYCTKPSGWAALIVVVGFMLLGAINQNYWAIAALPVSFFLSRIDIPVKRFQWAFYVFYPLHLTMIWCGLILWV